MADNVLKAVVDAISEEDNELGGLLITRLVQAHKWGRNDAFLETANPTRISVPSGTGWFLGAIAGDEYDLISGSFIGRYTVLTVDGSGDFITVEFLGGGTPSFTDEDPVKLRTATLHVETAFEFPDPAVTLETGLVWVGIQENVVSYGAVQVAVGDMELQQLGDPDTGVGYLTEDHRVELEVTDASRSYSFLDLLRRALLVEYADGVDLDRVGRNLAVVRQRGTSDTVFRALVKVLAYLPRGTTYALELVLEAFFPGGGFTGRNIPFPAPVDKWLIYEDLANENNTVFILPPTLSLGGNEEGRAFFHGYEDVTASSTTTVDVLKTPITIVAIQLQRVLQELEMTVLPSADSPVWTYTGEGAVPPGEGATFILGALDQLTQVPAAAPSSNSGRYSRTVADLAAPSRYQDWEFSVWWRLAATATVNGYPWHIRVRDGEVDVTIDWDDTSIRAGGVTVAQWSAFPALTEWHQLKVRRKGGDVTVYVDSLPVSQIPVAIGPFPGDANTDFDFGYFNQAGASQDWSVWWDRASIRVDNQRNWWNYYSDTGDLSIGDDWIDETVGTPFVAGDTGKRVRIYSGNNENDGEWLATYSTTTRLLLDGIVRGQVAVNSAGSEGFIVLQDPLFRPNDVGKTVTISGSGLGNDGDYPVAEFLNSYAVRVTGAPPFATETTGLSWKFSPSFVTEAGIVEYELIAAGDLVTKTLTARQAWPAAAQPLKVDYTNVLSAQLLRNETVRNDGSIVGVDPNVFYPIYLFDVSASLRNVIDEVTAAGVIPDFLRTF